MNNVWFTSDQHFDHAAIIDYCKRPFKNVNKMNSEIVNKYQQLVDETDTVYFLGDLSLRTSEHIQYYRKLMAKLPGKKHLILGNHDSLKPFTYIDIGFISVHTSFVYQSDEIKFILNHDPAAAIVSRNDFWLCGHIHDLFKTCKRVINVGVDVWEYYPVSLGQLEKLAMEIINEGW